MRRSWRVLLAERTKTTLLALFGGLLGWIMVFGTVSQHQGSWPGSSTAINFGIIGSVALFVLAGLLANLAAGSRDVELGSYTPLRYAVYFRRNVMRYLPETLILLVALPLLTCWLLWMRAGRSPEQPTPFAPGIALVLNMVLTCVFAFLALLTERVAGRKWFTVALFPVRHLVPFQFIIPLLGLIWAASSLFAVFNKSTAADIQGAVTSAIATLERSIVAIPVAGAYLAYLVLPLAALIHFHAQPYGAGIAQQLTLSALLTAGCALCLVEIAAAVTRYNSAADESVYEQWKQFISSPEYEASLVTSGTESERVAEGHAASANPVSGSAGVPFPSAQADRIYESTAADGLPPAGMPEALLVSQLDPPRLTRGTFMKLAFLLVGCYVYPALAFLWLALCMSPVGHFGKVIEQPFTAPARMWPFFWLYWRRRWWGLVLVDVLVIASAFTGLRLPWYLAPAAWINLQLVRLFAATVSLLEAGRAGGKRTLGVLYIIAGGLLTLACLLGTTSMLASESARSAGPLALLYNSYAPVLIVAAVQIAFSIAVLQLRQWRHGSQIVGHCPVLKAE